jgi:hypothetical protein
MRCFGPVGPDAMSAYHSTGCVLHREYFMVPITGFYHFRVIDHRGYA